MTVTLNNKTIDTVIAALNSAVITYEECQQQQELARTQFERAAFNSTGVQKAVWRTQQLGAERLVAQFAQQVLDAQAALDVFESLEVR